MIHHIVQFALRQRLLVLLLVAFIAVGGAISFQHMPVDAYPDLSPPMVEVITQWPGHAAEEIERLVTIPTEVEMNGVPKMAVMRSISLYGLSDVIMTFDDPANGSAGPSCSSTWSSYSRSRRSPPPRRTPARRSRSAVRWCSSCRSGGRGSGSRSCTTGSSW